MTSEIDREPLISGLSALTEAKTKIDRLPTELLLCVLELVIDSENPPELFCLVSRRWYRSVVTCAAFWRFIDITLECYRKVEPATGLVSSIRRHIARSQAYGLEVTIDYGMEWLWKTQFRSAVLECAGINGERMSRWRTLKFNATDGTPLRVIDVFQHPTPALRELSICASNGLHMTLLFPHVPLLRVLHVPSIMGTITWPHSFRRLVSTLHVNNSQSHSTSDLLHSVPFIRTLHLGSTLFMRGAGKREPIELLHLRGLHATVPLVHPRHQPVLYLPCLTHLTLTCPPLRCLNRYAIVLGSDVDASSLDEIQVIESLMLVPALSVRAPSSVCAHASLRAYDPALSQSPASPSRFDWSCDGFYCTILRYLICSALVFILVLTDEISPTSPIRILLPALSSSLLLFH